MAGLSRGFLLLGAAALVGMWLWRHQTAPAPATGAASAAAVSPSTSSPISASSAPPPVQGRLPGMPMPPPIESASPSEIAALRQAEVEHSQARPAVASYTGADGRQHAFRYQQTEQEALGERVREEREASLRRELEADPAAFARRYGLRAREIERILDGSAPFPPALLD